MKEKGEGYNKGSLGTRYKFSIIYRQSEDKKS
jgi:hypothetical protein